MYKDNHLVNCLRSPEIVLNYQLSDWDLLIRQARLSRLLAKLFYHLAENDLQDKIPENILKHMESACLVTERHAQKILWETSQIRKDLSNEEVNIVVLKGAAYTLLKLPFTRGRLFFDIDILIPKKSIEQVEKQLWYHGWLTTHHDEYDQRYYRKWMHEIPPLRHATRETILDVHHTILPLTSKLKPDANKLMQSSVPIAGHEGLYVLSPADMILHSATHLFHEGEMDHALRDLVDLDGLISHYCQNEGFSDELIKRAKELDLTYPLSLAIRYTQLVLRSQYPGNLHNFKDHNISPFRLYFLDWLFMRAFQPNHFTCKVRLSDFSEWCLYIRSHYLRMPVHLLFPHLFYKAFIKPWKERKEDK